MKKELKRVEGLGGEGLMIRQPKSKYVNGRSSTLLKIKTFHDAEVRISFVDFKSLFEQTFWQVELSNKKLASQLNLKY